MRFANGYKSYDIAEEQPARPCGSTFGGMTPTGAVGGFQQPLQQQMIPSQQVMPPLPTGYPTGGTVTPLLPSQTGVPAVPVGEQLPVTLQSTLFTPGFLKTQIGRRMRVEFLIGTGTLIDRTGTLLAVGASYILLRLIESDDVMMCDIYSIKFATIFH